jgi:hypothetical protein
VLDVSSTCRCWRRQPHVCAAQLLCNCHCSAYLPEADAGVGSHISSLPATSRTAALQLPLPASYRPGFLGFGYYCICAARSKRYPSPTAGEGSPSTALPATSCTAALQLPLPASYRPGFLGFSCYCICAARPKRYPSPTAGEGSPSTALPATSCTAALQLPLPASYRPGLLRLGCYCICAARPRRCPSPFAGGGSLTTALPATSCAAPLQLTLPYSGPHMLPPEDAATHLRCPPPAISSTALQLPLPLKVPEVPMPEGAATRLHCQPPPAQPCAAVAAAPQCSLDADAGGGSHTSALPAYSCTRPCTAAAPAQPCTAAAAATAATCYCPFQAPPVPGTARSKRCPFQALPIPGTARSRHCPFKALPVPAACPEPVGTVMSQRIQI